MKSLGEVVKAVLNVMMNVKSINASLNYYLFLETAFGINEYVFSTAVKEALWAKKDSNDKSTAL